MHPFFTQHPFRADAPSDLENDAKLALHLVLYLLSLHQPADGTWPGAHIAATLRHTCHALEALHLFGLEAASEVLESGIAWLVNLSNIASFDSGDEEQIRLYPSRFKTLAWLGEFSAPSVIDDFEDGRPFNRFVGLTQRDHGQTAVGHDRLRRQPGLLGEAGSLTNSVTGKTRNGLKMH